MFLKSKLLILLFSLVVIIGGIIDIRLQYRILMRIFVTVPDETGSLRKARLILIDCNTTDDLLRRVYNLCKYQREWLIVKLRQQLINIRITEGWPLEKYPLKQNSQIIVEIMPQGYKSLSPQGSTKKLGQIDEQLELQIQDNSTTGIPDQKLSFLSDDNDWTKYFEDSLEQFLAAIRKKSIQQASNILKSQPECNDEKLLNKILQKKAKFLLNQTGICGRTALHWAVQQKDLDMVQFLLIKSCDPNAISNDDYTPLQLAIVLRASSIFQTLVSHPRIDLNKLTHKGTALHLSVQQSQLAYAQKLLDCGAIPDIENQFGTTVIQLCTKLNIKGLRFNRNQKQTNKQLPNWLRGNLYKVSSFASRLKQRVLIVNPFSNQFFLLQNQQPQYKIMLNKVTSIQMLKNLSWSMKKQYYYFQVICPQVQLTLCVKNSKIGIQWVQGLQKCVKYCKTKQQFKVPVEQQLIRVLDDSNNTIVVHKRKTNKPEKISKKENNFERISILDLKPINENAKIKQNIQQPQNKKNISYSQNRKFSLGQLSQIPQIPFLPQPQSEITETDYLRESQLLGSVIGNSFLSKSFGKLQLSNGFDIKDTPLVCYRDFQIIKQLGNGSFGKVFLARHKKQQKLYALKVLNKKKLMAKKQMKYAVSEVNILKKVNNNFIIKLHYSFQTPTNLYIAIDYCPHGDLSQLLTEQQNISERVCKFYIAQIILAIQYLHEQKIIYRDLKPENILIGSDGFIRLTDFNLSKQNIFSMSFCGSPAYLSPQMLQKKGVGFQADIYGIGCVLYEMLVGEPPFFDDDISVLYENIKNGKLKFPSGVSKAAKNLIAGLLQRNVHKRIGVKNMNQIKKHQFFDGFDWKKLEKLQMRLPLQLQSKFQDKVSDLFVISEHGFQDADYQNNASMINRIKNFTFVREK